MSATDKLHPSALQRVQTRPEAFCTVCNRFPDRVEVRGDYETGKLHVRVYCHGQSWTGDISDFYVAVSEGVSIVVPLEERLLT